MTFYIFAIGCQMNHSDAERVVHILETNGYERATSEQVANLIIVVSCSVRQKAMDRIFGRLALWRTWRLKRGVKTVLTGCVLPTDKKRLRGEFDVLLDIKDIGFLPKRLQSKPAEQPEQAITNADYLALPSHHHSSFQAYVPIMTGCNNYCTYCAVPYTRGQEASRPSLDIINEVKALLKKGCKEITLLGQNVNAYIDPTAAHAAAVLHSRSRNVWQFNKNQPIQWRSATTKVPKDFATLLKKINELPGNFWIRFLTSNPQDVSEELIATLPRCDKVMQYFHLPIQAGDDEVLRRMNRRHTREYYLGLIKRIRRAWPGVAISTDVIVGFPGETKEQFKKTVGVFETVRYDMAYLAEYSPRPGTAAARFFKDDVAPKEKTRRKEALNDILRKTALEQNKKLQGEILTVLVESHKVTSRQNMGKTPTFKNVRFTGANLVGQFARVKITKAEAWGLAGTLVEK